jgi:hypothetical protein
MDSSSVNLSVTNEELPISSEEVKLLDLVKQEALTLLKEKIIQEIGEKEVDKKLLMKLLVIAMETIEKTKVKGKDQKLVVIDALIQVIKSTNVKVSNEEKLLSFLNNDIDDVIDLVVDASKGKIDINKAEKYTVSLVKCLFSCLKKN